MDQRAVPSTMTGSLNVKTASWGFGLPGSDGPALGRVGRRRRSARWGRNLAWVKSADGSGQRDGARAAQGQLAAGGGGLDHVGFPDHFLGVIEQNHLEAREAGAGAAVGTVPDHDAVDGQWLRAAALATRGFPRRGCGWWSGLRSSGRRSCRRWPARVDPRNRCSTAWPGPWWRRFRPALKDLDLGQGEHLGLAGSSIRTTRPTGRFAPAASGATPTVKRERTKLPSAARPAPPPGRSGSGIASSLIAVAPGRVLRAVRVIGLIGGVWPTGANCAVVLGFQNRALLGGERDDFKVAPASGHGKAAFPLASGPRPGSGWGPQAAPAAS